MTDTPTSYALTPEYFARARADLDRRRKELVERHEEALAAIAGHEAALELLDSALAKLDADERTVIEIAENYAASAPVAPAPIGKSRPSNANRPYTAADDVRIAEIYATTRGTERRAELRRLAAELGRRYTGVQKHHEELKKLYATTDTPAPAPDIEPPPPEPPASEPPQVVEPAPAPAVVPPAETRRTLPPRSRDVTGPLLDSGPGDRRIYNHPEAFASKQGD